jgi:hypothetical protein
MTLVGVAIEVKYKLGTLITFGVDSGSFENFSILECSYLGCRDKNRNWPSAANLKKSLGLGEEIRRRVDSGQRLSPRASSPKRQPRLTVHPPAVPVRAASGCQFHVGGPALASRGARLFDRQIKLCDSARPEIGRATTSACCQRVEMRSFLELVIS